MSSVFCPHFFMYQNLAVVKYVCLGVCSEKPIVVGGLVLIELHFAGIEGPIKKIHLTIKRSIILCILYI
jgi:hypothetical protein